MTLGITRPAMQPLPAVMAGLVPAIHVFLIGSRFRQAGLAGRSRSDGSGTRLEVAPRSGTVFGGG